MDHVSPLVSVVVPTYNRAQWLPRALQSVVEQDTTVVVEVLVVDDGSEDGTDALVREKFPSVRLIQQSNRGVSAARNVGIRAARGEWIALLDSDDVWLPSKLREQLAALALEPHYRFCHTEEIWIRNGVRLNPMNKHQKSGGQIFERCLPLCCISPSSALIHRSLFDEFGLFDEGLPACEDYDLWLRICAREEVLFIDKPLLQKYGGHADQLSRKHWGMDRFRIAALSNLLKGDRLSAAQRAATLQMLIQKLEIVLLGAKKRGNKTLIDQYEPVLNGAIREQEKTA